MVLSRGLGTQRRVLLGRAHCGQLELRLHTVIFIPKSQEKLATPGLGRPAFLGQACLNQRSVSNSPALALEARILFLVWILMGQSLGDRRGWGTSIPVQNKRGVCSQQPVNWKHWSQPTSSGHPGFSPRRQERRRQQDGWTAGRAGVGAPRREARASRELQCCGV